MTYADTMNRWRASYAVAAAVKCGALTRETACEACGTSGVRIHLHHWSYRPEHWVDVIPLCVQCHARVHSGKMREPRTGRDYTEHAKMARERVKEARNRALEQARKRQAMINNRNERAYLRAHCIAMGKVTHA